MILKRFFTAAAALFAIPAFCHAYFTQGDAGQEVFSFINTFDSPRNAALEKSAGAGVSTDPTITQLNPAAVTMLEGKRHVAAAHWQTGDMADNVGSLFYTAQLGTFIFQTSYNWQSYGSIDGYDEWGEATGEVYEPFSQLATATVTYPFKHFRFGTTLKFASDKLTDDSGDRTALAAAFDWGIAWQSESNRFGFALMGRDFGCLLRDYTDDGDDNYFPMSQTFAIAGFFRPSVLPRLTVFANSDFPRYQEAFLSLGGEYAIGSSLFARIGFQRTWLDITRDVKELLASKDRPDETNNAHMLSAGLGYAIDLFALDYSFSYLAEGMGHEHRLGLRINF